MESVDARIGDTRGEGQAGNTAPGNKARGVTQHRGPKRIPQCLFFQSLVMGHCQPGKEQGLRARGCAAHGMDTGVPGNHSREWSRRAWEVGTRILVLQEGSLRVHGGEHRGRLTNGTLLQKGPGSWAGQARLIVSLPAHPHEPSAGPLAHPSLSLRR